jgi:hypothetical protein
MRKKPSLTTSKESRLQEAKRELELEDNSPTSTETTQRTTFLIESDLLYSAKEVALKRKRAGIKPDTITGMVKEALQKIVAKELNK